MTKAEQLGVRLGELLAPLAGLGSALRHARILHPRGITYQAHVTPLVDHGDAGRVAARLAGPALVRLSGAWWRFAELPDVLGLAIRFRRSEVWGPEAEAGDQDLLLATVKHPWTLPFAPLRTRVHDFLANDYFGVSPFQIAGLGRAHLRAVGPRCPGDAVSRESRLAQAVADGQALFRLEVRMKRGAWQPLAQLALEHPLTLDHRALRFSPFRDGLGLHPVGFIHAMRLGPYALSQATREAAAR